MFSSSTVACSGGDPDSLEELTGSSTEEVARVNGTPGNAGGVSGLAVRVNFPGSYCSGTLVGAGNPPTARWVITAAHCGGGTPDPSEISISKQGGGTVTPVRVWTHPLGTHFLGSGFDGPGKVDARLLELSTATSATATFLWSDAASASNLDGLTVVAEGYGSDVSGSVALRNGAFTARVHELESNLRLSSSVFTTEGGDSGGGTWHLSNGELLFVGVHQASNKDTGVWAMRDWAQRVVECGGFDLNNPSENYCSEACPCQAGQGDCDSDSDCGPGLFCAENVGTDYGYPSGWEICLPITTPSNTNSGSCAAVGGCGPWQGDCNSHDDCLGDLVCRNSVGNAIGATQGVDVCDYPKMPTCPNYDDNDGSRNTTSGRCTPECPCSVGEGDCDTDADCRGMLVCEQGVGLEFGYSSSGVDVCVKP